ncbi:MAG: peroxiredoxin [Mycobacteriaceae bacterium]|jgi:peroxiredoxin Q/BCP
MKQGDTAPDFALADDMGNTRTLSEYLTSGPVVLFFYPIAASAGCTVEACHFRDLASEFAAVGAQRLGISPDSVTKQRQFSTTNSFDYPLLADEGGLVAAQFGVKRGKLLGKLTPVKRATFVIGTDRTVLAAFSSETNMKSHADRALEVLKANAA